MPFVELSNKSIDKIRDFYLSGDYESVSKDIKDMFEVYYHVCGAICSGRSFFSESESDALHDIRVKYGRKLLKIIKKT